MLTLAQAEKIVDRFENLFWDGWNVVIFNPKIDGFTKLAGMFHKGTWGVKRVVEPNSLGLYALPKRYLNVQRAA